MASRRPFSYRLEAALCFAFVGFFRCLPFKVASSVGSFLGQTFGVWLGANKVGQRNLRNVFPTLTEEEINKILHKMWGHFGRLPAEYLHPRAVKDPAVVTLEVEGEEVLEALRTSSRPALFVGGHFGNWQMATVVAARHGLKIFQFYRPANNPWFEKFYRHAQLQFVEGLIPKTSHSFRTLLQNLRKGNHVLLLFDQHMDKGVEVPFLGSPAQTTPAVIRLAQQTQSAVIFFNVSRQDPTRFRVRFDAPLDLSQDVSSLLQDLNGRLGACIWAEPEQWFWLHHRWKKGEKP